MELFLETLVQDTGTGLSGLTCKVSMKKLSKQAEHTTLKTKLNQQRHALEMGREEESARERANMKQSTKSLDEKVTARSKQLAEMRVEIERQKLDFEAAKQEYSESSASQVCGLR